MFDGCDRAVVFKFNAMLCGSPSESAWDRVHSALRKEDAIDRIHVSDDCVDGECLLWADTGIHRLERVDLLGAWVLQIVIDLWREPAESAQCYEFGQVGS